MPVLMSLCGLAQTFLGGDDVAALYIYWSGASSVLKPLPQPFHCET